MFSGAVVAGARLSKHDFFFVGFVGNIKESTFMVEIFQKTFHGSQDLTMKVAV